MAWASKVPCGEEEEGGEYILTISLEEGRRKGKETKREDDREGKKE
jgi:hypothetical protein